MDLTDAEALARQVMRDRLRTDERWTFGWDGSVARMGACDHLKHRITLSRKLTAAGTEAQVLDTILHEIAHANVGPVNGHNATWKREAIRLGAKPQASADDAPNIRAEAAPWVGTCAEGHVSKYRFWRKPRSRRSCSICQPGIFDPKYLITYIKEES